MEIIFFEKILIHFIFKNIEVRDKVIPYLSLKIFDDDKHIKIIEKIIGFLEKYKKFPSILELKVYFQNNDLYSCLIEIMNIDLTEYSHEFLIEEIEDFFKKKLINNALTDAAQNLIDDEINKIADSPDKLREAISFSFNNTVGFDFLEDEDRLYEHLHSKVQYIPSGVKTLDKLIKGGFHVKTLNLFLAEVNLGKSLVLASLASNALLQNKNVLYLTLEMSEEKVSERIAANIFDVNVNDLEYITKDKFHELYQKAKKNISNKLTIKEYAPKSFNANHLRNLIKEIELKKKIKPDIIFIDYLGIMTSCSLHRNDTLYAEVKRISEEVRAVAVEQNIPIISAIQTNRKGMNQVELDFTDVSESIGTAATADLLIGITQSDDLREAKQFSWILIKNRYGLNKQKIVVGVDYTRMRINDIVIASNEMMEISPNTKLNLAINDVINIKKNNKKMEINSIIDI
jgi:replicative DNA helicase